MKTFRDAVRKRNFTVTAECFLQPETNAESIAIQADILRDAVDAVLLTDNQYGQLHMSTLAAARLMLDSDVDPIVQLSCRNRNRIVLLADLLGAAALGVTSLLLVRGNRVPQGFEPRPKAVFDMNAKDLIATAAAMKVDERLRPPPNFFLGGVVTPHGPKADWVPKKLIEKADAGAQFFMTYLCMDIDLLRGYMKHLVAANLVRRISMIVHTAILSSAEDGRWLRENRSNVMIPDSILDRLEAADDSRQEGIAICAEQLSALATIPGIAGAHIMASTDLSLIPEAVQAADLGEEQG